MRYLEIELGEKDTRLLKQLAEYSDTTVNVMISRCIRLMYGAGIFLTNIDLDLDRVIEVNAKGDTDEN